VKRLWWIIPAAAILAVGALAAWWLRPAGQSPSFEPLTLTNFPGSEACPSFSPDGGQVVFHWNGEKEQQNDIYLRLIGGGPPLRLTTDRGAHLCPAWSPDGKSIAYYGSHPDGRNGVFLIPALGGPERLLLESSNNLFPAWSPDGNWIAASPPPLLTTSEVSVNLISVENGEHVDLGKVNAAFAGSREARFSPDGRWLAYTTTRGGSNTSSVWTVELTSDGKPHGSPRQITFSKLGANYPVWTADGREIVFQEGTPNSSGAISRVKPDGKGKVSKIPGLGYTSGPIAISRNGRMAFSRGGIDFDVWRYDLKGGEPPRKWIASTAYDSSGEYSPDGQRIVFSSNRSGARELWVCDAEGSNPVQITHFGGPVAGSPRWSPDGRQIVFDARPDGNADIFVIGSEGSGLRRLTQTPGEDARPDWSPDGKFIYFSSNRTGTAELWRMPATGGDAAQITKHGGFALRVSPDGQWLFYAPAQAYGPVWKIHPDGRDDSAAFSPRTYGLAMAISSHALYGATMTGPPASYSVQLLQFADGKISQLLPLDFSPGLGLSLTPDERYLLLTRPDQKGTDLMLVEGFR
jgi:Tol biopolymer transport system component